VNVTRCVAFSGLHFKILKGIIGTLNANNSRKKHFWKVLQVVYGRIIKKY